MSVTTKLLSAAAAVGIMASGAHAASILAVGQNRAAIYQVNYTGDPTVAANYSPTVSVYQPINVNLANEQPYAVAQDSSGNSYVSVASTGTGGVGEILKIAPNGTQTAIAVRGTNTPNWTTAQANGITVGPDGKIYFATAFGTGADHSDGVFSLNTDGSNFQQFVAPSGTGYTMPQAERDLTFAGSNLWVTSRNNVASNNLFEFNSAGAFQQAVNGNPNAETVTYGANSLLYVGSLNAGTGSISSYDPSSGTKANVVTSTTAPGTTLGIFSAPNGTGSSILYSDFGGGTGATGQIHVADATGDVVFSFAGKTDNTGASLNGFLVTDLEANTVVPEPTSLALIGGAAMLFARRRRRLA